MKKSALIILGVLFTFQLVSAKDTIVKEAAKLPLPAQSFLKEHFSEETISYITIDEELLSTEYDVIFISGVEVEFSKNGNWKEVDCKKNAVPKAIIPQKISQYVNENFGETFITKIEKNRREYEIKLSNKIELDFDLDGNFKRIDD